MGVTNGAGTAYPSEDKYPHGRTEDDKRSGEHKQNTDLQT
jgi:hypothetical protein